MYKQVLVIRKDLNMRKGKIAAQAGHAVVLSLLESLEVKDDKKANTFKVRVSNDILEWYRSGQAKICVYVESEEELLDIYTQAKTAGLPVQLVTDSGKTEFGGKPTKTAVGIGPAVGSYIDKITSHLKLY